MPPDAAVAYAAAISRGLTDVTPRVNGPTWSVTPVSGSNGTVMPMASAASTVLHSPASRSSWAKYVFTDRRRPVYMLKLPDPVELETRHVPVLPPSQSKYVPVGIVRFCG